MIEITQAVVRELLDYNPETGIFLWKWRSVDWFQGDERVALHAQSTWNTSRAGLEAGGSGGGDGYVRIGLVGGRRVKAHRLAFLWMEGVWPPCEVDHVNRVRNDNRWSNLRLATRSENTMNYPKRDGYQSRFKGVSFNPKSRRWRAIINADKKRTHIGYFATEEEAYAAYCEKAVVLHGEFARLA